MTEEERGAQTNPDAPKQPNERDRISEAERIASLRARLYDRAKAPDSTERHTLAPQAPTSHPTSDMLRKAIYDAPLVSREAPRATPLPVKQAIINAHTPTVEDIDMIQKKRTRSYRTKLAVGGIIFFVCALIVSSAFLLIGNNSISGENITIEVTGPLAVGGGDELNLQAVITNKNSVPIESATLIVNYPDGTQSTTEIGKEIFDERLQLNNVESGEVVRVPLKVLVFGEENEEKNVEVSIEYRVRGSNAIFDRKAEPYRFKISTSPVTVKVDSVKSLSSGQKAEITLTIQSNSTASIADLLIKAVYPDGFDLNHATPEPVSGEDTWHIASLKPHEKKEIVIEGVLTGGADDIERFIFSAGVSNERDKFNLVSTLSSITHDITIEQPFLGIDVEINGDGNDTVAISPDASVTVVVKFKNTLDSMVHDGSVSVKLNGDVLNESSIDANEGFYDSTTNTIRWDSASTPSLREIGPGQSSSVTFTFMPRKDIGSTSQFTLSVTAGGQRVYEDRAPQELTGVESRTIKILSKIKFTSSMLYSEGPFTNSGPIPPVAEKVTQYTVLLSVDTGANGVAGAEVNVKLPQYMKWPDLVSEGDQVSYAGVDRTLKWTIGNMDANDHEEVWIQLSFLPSLSQVGKTPTLVETQYLKATDRFTGTTVRAEAPFLTTELKNDPDPSTHDGVVREE